MCHLQTWSRGESAATGRVGEDRCRGEWGRRPTAPPSSGSLRRQCPLIPSSVGLPCKPSPSALPSPFSLSTGLLPSPAWPVKRGRIPFIPFPPVSSHARRGRLGIVDLLLAARIEPRTGERRSTRRCPGRAAHLLSPDLPSPSVLLPKPNPPLIQKKGEERGT